MKGEGFIIVNDLLKILSEKKGVELEFYLSHWLSVNKVSEDLIVLEIEEDTPQNREQFKTHIKLGYWVYTYLVCVDELHFERFNTEEEAEQYYNSILLTNNDPNSLTVEKLILKVGV